MDQFNGNQEYSRRGVPVVITRLATTRGAAQETTGSLAVLPALDASQMDSFIDVGARMRKLEGLPTRDVCSPSKSVSPEVITKLARFV
jgi:hypothetical protein